MKAQYFITKLKDEFLPDIIFDSIENKKIKPCYPWNYTLFIIEQKYLRKIKIQNIQNGIDAEDKLLLEFILNDNFVKMLTDDESKKLIDKLSYNKYSSSGTAGGAGATGSVGITGISTPSNIINHWNKLGMI